ncbi:hypothetical protein KAU18_10145 [Candidatus Bathyarchaeota archaeon]|nr:hypothetical protein [Candidatus Bathyarchaeota archaeon]MCK4703159.1 hypothetical protein [Candidatus Bathyarchaeota archaeon]
MPEKKILYFDEIVDVNTEKTLAAAKKRADELGIKEIVVSSTRGGTALKALDLFGEGYKVIVVTHSAGFREPGKIEMADEAKEEIQAKGGIVLTTIHAFAGVDRAINKKFNTIGPSELVANVLRMFGQGMKVCVETVYMAADSGLLSMDSDVVSIAGTGKGCDTAIVVKPAHLNDMFDLYVKEIICKPTAKKR